VLERQKSYLDYIIVITKIIGQAYTTGNPLKPKHHTYNIETNKEYETLKNILEWHIRLSNSKHTKEIYDVID
jgi:hypothetical protein